MLISPCSLLKVSHDINRIVKKNKGLRCVMNIKQNIHSLIYKEIFVNLNDLIQNEKYIKH